MNTIALNEVQLRISNFWLLNEPEKTWLQTVLNRLTLALPYEEKGQLNLRLFYAQPPHIGMLMRRLEFILAWLRQQLAFKLDFTIQVIYH